MMSSLHKLGLPGLSSLSEALASGRLTPPFAPSELRHHAPRDLEDEIAAELREMTTSGMAPAHIARLLRAMVSERRALQAVADRVEVVWSGTEEPGSMTRDTAVVVRELFRGARRGVLIASYAVDKREKAAALFGSLAERLDADPELSVRLFLNVKRERHDERSESVVLREFAEVFRDEVWPGRRLPAVFYDPRSLEVGGPKRSCLHAKCIVVDEDRALVTSANFTEAAHERNVEAGLLVDDRQVARTLRAQFETLVERGVLRRVPGL